MIERRLRKMTDHPKMQFGHAIRLLASLVLLAVCAPSHAFNFTPTEAEWAAWPAYCKARYAKTNMGSGSIFASRVPPTEIARWDAQLGDAFKYLHHHCAGLTYLDRAKLESDPAQRKYLIGRSIAENLFAYEHTPPSHPLSGEILARTCLSYREGGDRQKAMETCNAAIRTQPTVATGYGAKALLYRDQNRDDLALKVLLDGDVATGGTSAELNQFIAVMYIKQGQMAEAQKHASIAYANGYPLPGLRNRLAKAGYPVDISP